MNTQEELKAKRNELVTQLSDENHESTFKQLKEIDKQIKEANKIDLLRGVNGKYNRLREMAKQAYECEQPSEDVTTNDGSLHKVKVKKYPKLAALQYASANWEDGRITELRINGVKFYMYKTKHEYNKPTEYTRPATWEEFLDYNSIPLREITMQEFNDMSEKLNALNEKLDAAAKEYETGLKALNIHSYNYWGLVGQSNTHTYKYSPN